MKSLLSLELRRLVKERDLWLWRTYEEILGIACPANNIEIHHVKPHGEGGEDKESNLISLDPWVHRTVFHTTMGHVDPEWKEKAMAYLNCVKVRAWRLQHMHELNAIYREHEEERIKKKRAGCIPKKRPGLPF